MKIAFVTFDFPPFTGSTGSGVYAEHVVRELVLLDHEVFVYTPKIDGQLIEHSNTNVNINRVALSKNFPFKALQFWMRLPASVIEDHRSQRFDIIHFNSLCYWFIKKKIIDVPHIMTAHHLTKDANESLQLHNRFLNVNLHAETAFILPYIEKRALESVDKIIAVSKYTKERIIKSCNVPPSKIDVIYNGIDFDNNAELQFLKERVRQTYNIPEKPIILFVGRTDDPRKGLDVLLKAFLIVRERYDTILVAVGNSSNTKAKQLAKKLGIKSQIIFTGFVPDNILRTLYTMCSVYVNPSRLEGFGLTILEAMASAKPIVATNVAAIPELVENGINGILVESEDIKGLAEGICRFLRDPTVSAEMGLNNQKYAAQFNWRNNAKEIERSYLTLVKPKKESAAA